MASRYSWSFRPVQEIDTIYSVGVKGLPRKSVLHSCGSDDMLTYHTRRFAYWQAKPQLLVWLQKEKMFNHKRGSVDESRVVAPKPRVGADTCSMHAQTKWLVHLLYPECPLHPKGII